MSPVGYQEVPDLRFTSADTCREDAGSGPRDPVEHPQRLLVGARAAARSRRGPAGAWTARTSSSSQRRAISRVQRVERRVRVLVGAREHGEDAAAERRHRVPVAVGRGHRRADRGGPGGPGERVDVPGGDVDEHQVVPERRRRCGRAAWAAPRRGRSPRAGAPGTGGSAGPDSGSSAAPTTTAPAWASAQPSHRARITAIGGSAAPRVRYRQRQVVERLADADAVVAAGVAELRRRRPRCRPRESTRGRERVDGRVVPVGRAQPDRADALVAPAFPERRGHRVRRDGAGEGREGGVVGP